MSDEVKKQKIFYLITKGNLGGAQKYVLELASALPKDQFDVTVFFGEGTELENRLKLAGIKTQKIEGLGRDIKLSGDWKTFWTLVHLFKQEKPDIIHLNSSKIGLLGALAGRFAGVPKIIFTGHGWAFNEPRSAWQKLAIKILHWLTVILCHQVIAVSEKTKLQLAHWPLIKNKFTVIHNGIPPIDFLSKTEARQELAKIVWKKGFDSQALDNAMIVGTIAELHKNKGLDFLLTALGGIKGKLENVLIWIIGDGEEIDRLKEQAKRLRLKDHVTFLGKIPEASRFLRAFDIFTLTSRTEAFPYALLEAGQAGLPVIASSAGGIPEIISEFNQGILVRPGNTKEIKLALVRLLENPSERQKFGDNLAKKVNKEFTVEKMVEKTLELYENKQ